MKIIVKWNWEHLDIMKKKIFVGLKAFFTAYALTAVFQEPFFLWQFETVLDYIIASVYEVLGEYRLEFVLIWLLTSVFYYRLEGLDGNTCPKAGMDWKKGSSRLLAGFFAMCLLVGRSYYKIGSWDYCFGSPANLIKFGLSLIGYGYLFYALMGCAAGWLKKERFVGPETHFFSKNAFWKVFLILIVVYSPVVLICYPGVLCWDTIGQIEQVILETGYSTHHPLVHTLLVGGLIKFGHFMFGAYEPGLFMYMILQIVMLAAALSATVAVLAARKVRFRWLACLVALYCISPIYSNIVSVAIKDVPYCAFVIGYGICFVLLLETPEYIKNKKFLACFVLMQVGAILFRNNGLPMVCLSGLGALIYLFRKYTWKERLRYCLAGFAISIAIGKLITLLLMQATGAVKGGAGEMFSIPFQQTARYLQLYSKELSPEEREAIEEVFGSAEHMAYVYDPNISDPVKALYDKSSTTEELMVYFGAWAKGLIKHPVVYVEAFLNHVYGWFTAGVNNGIRYEVPVYDSIFKPGIFSETQKVVLFLYRFADRLSLLSILQNVGAYVWGLFFLAYFQYKEKKAGLLYGGLPLWISLLVCMASPCYIYHPRYALPIVFLLPFLYGVTVSGKEKRTYE